MGSTMTRIKTIVLYEDIIEIHHNENLTHNPYLVRFSNFSGETYEMRLDEENLKELSSILNTLYESQNI